MPQQTEGRRRVASATEVVKIHAPLTKHVQATGFKKVAYLNGMTDERLAQAAGVAVASIMRVRREMFGDLRHAGGAGSGVAAKRSYRHHFNALLERIRERLGEDWSDLKFDVETTTEET